jgi:hypothetical protein
LIVNLTKARLGKRRLSDGDEHRLGLGFAALDY